MSFELAAEVFDDPFYVVVEDQVIEGEQRFWAFGRLQNLIVIVVVHTYSNWGSRVASKKGCESYLPEKPPHWREDSMKKKLSEEARNRELERLANLPDASIDTSDIPERSLEELRRGRRRDLFRPIKLPVTMRIDADILEWLKEQGPGYQTKVNRILREEMSVAQGKSLDLRSGR